MKEKVDMIIPELREEWLNQIVRNNILMMNLSVGIQEYLVVLIIGKLNVFYNYAFDKDNQQKQMQAEQQGQLQAWQAQQQNQMQVWIAGLCDLTTRQLLGGIVHCLTGKTKYIEFPPLNVIAFGAVCRDAEFPRDYFEALPVLEHERTEASKLAAQGAISEMKKMLGGMLSTWRVEKIHENKTPTGNLIDMKPNGGRKPNGSR